MARATRGDSPRKIKERKKEKKTTLAVTIASTECARSRVSHQKMAERESTLTSNLALLAIAANTPQSE